MTEVVSWMQQLGKDKDNTLEGVGGIDFIEIFGPPLNVDKDNILGGQGGSVFFSADPCVQIVLTIV